ncbi:T9SS type A sorting domain-containing protein [Dyadobacter sp. UC 10]|nr:T9SS type A sorting domain-containing protein [Dyadobacter sp. UC 10]
MHTTLKNFTFSILLCLLVSVSVFAQWGAPYTNNWIAYGKPYVKIAVSQRGIHKVPMASLPAGFPKNQPSLFQIWHRGKQVSIISTENNEITFFGVPNDGALDSLLYRPMSSRLNPYFSHYSDESAYFLTVGDAAGSRAEKVNKTVDPAVSPLAAHNAILLNVFKDEYSFSIENPIRAALYNSFFELGASRTSKPIIRGTQASYPFELANRNKSSAQKVSVKMLMQGRSNNSRPIEIYIGKDAQSLRLAKTINISGFSGGEAAFDIEATDVDANNKGVLALKSTSTEQLERFSLAYYKLVYPSAFVWKGPSTTFSLPGISGQYGRITISGAPNNATVLDITDPHKVKLIAGDPKNLMVPGNSSKSSELFVTSESFTVPATKITSVDFKAIDIKTANYFIVTSANLKEGAEQYAAYRSSQEGGKFSTSVVLIQDIYNQFNFGEPSPLAIRRFVDFALSTTDKNKYLLLMGRSITHVERMKRELPDEVPTIGFPGSDFLLVEGLGGAAQDVGAIPVGRLSAITNQHVLDYLEKVKDYESNMAGDYGWRKTFLHLNGGKSTSEISQLKNQLSSLTPFVTGGFVGGNVKAFAKQQGVPGVESVNITPEVNEGAGLITYFGHGSIEVTDLDMGYATDVGRRYNNVNKYPMMYFNGCGVGNIFSARFNTSPTASNRYPLSLDWLLAPKKGSVAVIANSFESFVSPSAKYLEILYKTMFTDPASINLSIGKIMMSVASKVMASDPGAYTISNAHQSLLQGDPALKLVTVAKPDYSLDPDESLMLYSQSQDKKIGVSDSVRLSIAMHNQGRYFQDEKVLVKIISYSKTGEKTLDKIVPAFALQDTLNVMLLRNREVQRIEVRIDPLNAIAELDETNNIAELVIDWDAADSENRYPLTKVKDLIPPVLEVRVNQAPLKNEASVSPDPTLAFILEDNRLISPDTSFIDVFIKSCWDDKCEYRPIKYTAGDFRMDTLSSRSFMITLLKTDLPEGEYELLVNVSDVAGNAGVQPYSIKFKVENTADSRMSVVCSPNPAVSYIKLETKLGNYGDVKSLKYTIYDLTGKVVAEETKENRGQNLQDWYWQPTAGHAGLFIYKVTKTNAENELEEVRGKFVILR